MPCLVREDSKKFMDAIRDGRITPEKMLKATSKERQAILGGIIGPENAGWVNAALEAKILLKDQNRGMVTWAKKVGGITPAVRRDMLTTIQKNTRVFDPTTADTFLESLAAKKMGAEITFDEAKNVSDFATKVETSKAKIAPDEPHGSPNRLEYGDALVAFKNYVGDLKQHAARVGDTFPSKALWYLKPKHWPQSFVRSAGAAKSFLSTLDNSWFGRQGIKMLLKGQYRIWGKGFLKSWVDIGRELIGRDAMDVIRSEAYSRPNAINGKYDALGIDIGLQAEEAFPSQVLTKIKIPFLSRLGRIPRHIAELPGRIPKAAESAFNGAALRFRVDYADKLIAKAEAQGINLSDPAEAQPIGKLINSTTGRGFTGRVSGQAINSTIFSIKFLKSNFDTLTAHQFQKGVTPFVRKEAAMNLLKIVGSLAGVYTISNMLKPGSVELDPRSGKFGKIQIGNTTFDPSGGMTSLVTLASRMMPTMHNGKLGFYTKNAKGEVVELGTGKYGVKDALDVFWDFWEGKLAPYAALFRDMWHGTDFQGRKTYVEQPVNVPGVGDISRIIPNPRTILQAHAPIPAQNFVQNMNAPDAAPLLISTILDGLGISTNTYTPPAKKEKPEPSISQRIKAQKAAATRARKKAMEED